MGFPDGFSIYNFGLSLSLFQPVLGTIEKRKIEDDDPELAAFMARDAQLVKVFINAFL